ncbi:MAG: MFS transporter [Desulfococcaceae bacterium]|nr:MFS transporter [Desulfococcaceae bacterium]
MNHIIKNPMYRYLAVLTVCSTAGLQIWRTLFDNFAVNVAFLDGNHIGFIQSVREIPGFLTFLTVYILIVMREHRLSAFSVLLMGAGIGMTGLFPSFSGLMLTTFLMSLGFHYYETTNMSLPLQYFNKETSPLVFGQLRRLAAASNIAVGVLILLAEPFFSYMQIYSVTGFLIVFISFRALMQDPSDRNLPIQLKKPVFRKCYGLFYFLTFLAGARRQIFIAFAVFLLVKKFGYSVRDISILFLLNNCVNFFLSTAIAKAIVRFGERKVLSLEYFSLIFIFVSYALTESAFFAGLLYVLDHIFFNFSVAIRTYYQKIAAPEDMASGMAVGFTINHIAAVLLPAAGGMLWMVDYRIPFFFGAGLSLLSLAAVQKIRTEGREFG